MRMLGCILLALSVLIGGCSLFEGESEDPLATQEAEKPTPVATPTLMSDPQSTSESNPAAFGYLNVWIANQFSTLNDPVGGIILENQFNSYQSSNPDLALNIQGKVASGPAGILNYLQAGTNIAPSIMPDLVMLPSEDLDRAVSDGLIYPMNGFLEQEMVDDLFPAAGIISQVDGLLYGYPFTFTDMHHLAYDREILTEPFPAMWDDMLELEEASFVFPAAGEAGAEMVLQLYLAAGGALIDENNQPVLEVEPLTQALGLFNRGTTRRVILRESANLATTDQVWQEHLDGDAVIVQSEASAFLTDRQSKPVTDGYGP